MAVHSGKFGVVNGVSTVRDWSVTDQAQNPRWVASNTRGGTGRSAGVRSWSGSFNQYGHTPIVMPGEVFAFVGYTAPDDDISGAGVTYEGDAIVDSVQLTWNWSSGDILQIATSFSGHLDLAASSGSYTDVTDPGAYPICPCRVDYDHNYDDTYLEWENISQAVLNITAANQAYVNSSTDCWTGRKPGPIDWTLALTEQDNTRDANRDINTVLAVRLYVDAANYWQLKWGRVENYSNLQVNRETGAIISRNVNLAMTAFRPGSSTIGSIRLPDGSVFWPEGVSSA